MNDTDLAYAAGIIDGEGTILITHYKERPNRQAGYRVVVEVGMCDSAVPMWLYAKFGGRLKDYERPNIKHRRVYRWNNADSKAVEFLRLILPYLKTKKAQAEIAIEYQEIKLLNRTKYTYRKPLVFLQVEAILAEKVHKLNTVTAADDA